MNRYKLMKLRALIEKGAVGLPDEDALEGIELYPLWQPDKNYILDQRIRYEGKLYRVRQNHTSRAQYPPSIDTASLYSEVAKPGQGDTPSNPIPYSGNMELVEGKYYEQYSVIYLCFRSTGVPVYHNLADLVGLYVNVYTPN